MQTDPERVPVIVGIGQVNDRPGDPRDGLDPVGLMVEALRRADADARGGLLADCGSLAVIGQIGWPQLNPVAGMVADALGIAPSHVEETTPHGDNPVRMLNEAANRVGRGEATVCAVTGGEALRTAAQLARLKAETEGGNSKHDALRNASHRRKVGYAQSHGLVVPTDVYPLYENATRAAWGQSLAEAQSESGAIWARFSEVAANNEAAWIDETRSAEEIVEPSADNRPIAFPYTKLQVANSSVNMGAGFIVASLAEARRHGLAEERLVHIGHGAAAFEAENFLARADYASSPGMAVSIEQAMALNGLEVGDLDHVELYSCFPCVPKMARRVLGWPVERPASVFGGLTFGGGPIGNYMSHAIAAMVERLRESKAEGRAEKGLLFANGGYATHNHTIALSAEPIEGIAFPQDFDFQAEADARRAAVPELDRDYTGPARVETYTAFYRRDGSPRVGTVVALTPKGKRTLASVPASDEATIAALTDGTEEPVGRSGRITKRGDALAVWRFA